ncbi:MAG: adenylyl-sulfate kinase, partial [Nitrospira sp.]|nr:adenylyl-sulfate kinase [Nitrospira sp.]
MPHKIQAARGLWLPPPAWLISADDVFSNADRVENIRRVAETAKLTVDAGLIVLVSFIYPFRSEREVARKLVDEGEFLEVLIDTPLEISELRDVK